VVLLSPPHRETPRNTTKQKNNEEKVTCDIFLKTVPKLLPWLRSLPFARFLQWISPGSWPCSGSSLLAVLFYLAPSKARHFLRAPRSALSSPGPALGWWATDRGGGGGGPAARFFRQRPFNTHLRPEGTETALRTPRPVGNTLATDLAAISSTADVIGYLLSYICYIPQTQVLWMA
jgi:hypothetical protein